MDEFKAAQQPLLFQFKFNEIMESPPPPPWTPPPMPSVQKRRRSLVKCDFPKQRRSSERFYRETGAARERLRDFFAAVCVRLGFV